jgi:uncharacterized membrane protein YdfJ with MMPL/SSD domain
MAKKYWLITISLYLVVVLVWPLLAAAGNPLLEKLDDVASNKGPYKLGDQEGTHLLDIIGTAIGIGLGLLGVLFLVLMIYAGYMWMTAHGNEEKVQKAKNIIVQVLIGIVVVVGAYASWKYLFSRLFF